MIRLTQFRLASLESEPNSQHNSRLRAWAQEQVSAIVCTMVRLLDSHLESTEFRWVYKNIKLVGSLDSLPPLSSLAFLYSLRPLDCLFAIPLVLSDSGPKASLRSFLIRCSFFQILIRCQLIFVSRVKQFGNLFCLSIDVFVKTSFLCLKSQCIIFNILNLFLLETCLKWDSKDLILFIDFIVQRQSFFISSSLTQLTRYDEPYVGFGYTGVNRIMVWLCEHCWAVASIWEQRRAQLISWVQMLTLDSTKLIYTRPQPTSDHTPTIRTLLLLDTKHFWYSRYSSLLFITFNKRINVWI